LFLQRCAGCHGAGAEGKIGPPIKGATLDRVTIATERVALMMDLASLDPEELYAIVDSLPAGLPVVALPGGTTDGRLLFSTNCAGCHGADANGGIGPAIRGATRANITHAIGEVAMMIAMKSLNDESIDAIGGYLLGLATDPIESFDRTTVGVPEGMMVYSMICIGCHAEDARGQIGPSIRGKSESDIEEAIGRVPMMAALKELDLIAITAVGSYLKTLDTKDAVSDESRSPDGEKIYASSCSACHGEDGGGHIGPDIKGSTRDDVKAAIDRVPMMIGVQSLTEQQIAAVGAYVGSLAVSAAVDTAQQPPDGDALFNTHCAACHGADARGRVGPDIVVASFNDITAAIDRVPMMIAMKTLGARDINAVADHLTVLQEQASTEIQE
jgi:mono/diheme cytochrome c family protein